MSSTNWQIQVGAKVTDNIQAQLNKLPTKTITVTPVLNTSGLQTGTKTVTQYTTATGNAVTVTEKLNSATGKTSSQITKFKDNVSKATNSIDSASKSTSTLSSRFIDIIKKVTAFGLATSIIGGVTSSIYEAVDATYELNEATTEFSKVSDYAGETLDEYVSKLSDLGDEVARTTSEMLEASAMFVKSGYSEEDSAQLAYVASLYQNVADAEVDASSASAFIVSQLKAFSMEADDAIEIVNELNEVSNQFSVSSSDIATALTKSSSALATYGNSMSETIGLVTAG